MKSANSSIHTPNTKSGRRPRRPECPHPQHPFFQNKPSAVDVPSTEHPSAPQNPFLQNKPTPGNPERLLGPFPLPPLPPFCKSNPVPSTSRRRNTPARPTIPFCKTNPSPVGAPADRNPSYFCKTNPSLGAPSACSGPSPPSSPHPFLQNEPNLHPPVILQNKPKSGRRPRRPECFPPPKNPFCKMNRPS